MHTNVKKLEQLCILFILPLPASVVEAGVLTKMHC